MPYSNLVYMFKCNICNYSSYGKTKRHFKVRACEHLGITTFTGKKIKRPKESAVFDRIFHTGHNASFVAFEPLSKSLINLDSFSKRVTFENV